MLSRELDGRYLLCERCLRIVRNPFAIPRGAQNALVMSCAVGCSCGATLRAPDMFAGEGEVWISDPGSIASVVIERMLKIAKQAQQPGANLDQLTRDVESTIPPGMRGEGVIQDYLAGLRKLARTPQGAAFVTVLLFLIFNLIYSWASGAGVRVKIGEIEYELSPETHTQETLSARLDALTQLYQHLVDSVSSLERSAQPEPGTLDRINARTQALLRLCR